MTKWMHLRRIIFKDETGQILPSVVFGIVAMIGVTGLGLDFGQAFIVQRQLQTAASSAALAGAQALPGDPTAQATQYSAQTGGKNASSITGASVPQIQGKCLTALTAKGIPCMGPTYWNAVQVKQSANVPTMFLRALNILPGVNLTNIPVSATATAGRLAPRPVNIAVVVDMTGSLDVPEPNDPSCDSSHLEYQCQLYAVQSMLTGLQPCANGVTGSACTDDKAYVHIALFTFPNISKASLDSEFNCGGSPQLPSGSKYTTKIDPEPYTFPSATASNYTTAGLTYSYTVAKGSNPPDISATYQITDFVSDYWAGGNPATLDASSKLVQAIGQGNGTTQTTPGCLNFVSGVVNSNVGNTYLAGAIYAAQAALVHEQSLHPNSMNYLIFMSDGKSNVTTAADGYNQVVSVSGGSIRHDTSKGAPGIWPTFATVSSSNSDINTNGLTTLNTNGTYPSTFDQCQQAVMAAYAASTATIPTTVIGVANGAPASGGCNDSAVVATGTHNVAITSSNISSACITMQNIATSPADFYSTTNAGCTDSLAVVGGSHYGAGDLLHIFQNFTFGLVRAVLIPNSTT